MNKKYWVIGVLVLMISAVLLYFLLHEPKSTDSHKDDYNRVLSENKAFQHREDSILRRADSLESSARSKDSVIAALKAEKKATQKQADKYAAAADRLAKEVKELRQGDTSEFARKCDSLAEAAISFKFLYEQYKDNSDSLTAKMDSQNEDYVQALEVRRKLFDELKVKYDALLKAYTELFTDYAKSQKTVRRERLKTKIAALLALVGGAAAVVK
jgi:peptidoglycan hydrolase CwlO-like protein